MADEKQSAAAHERFPHVPAKAVVKADVKCGGCPMASLPGHATCGAFGPGEAAVAAEQFNAKTVANWEWQVHRRQIDADGVPGAYNDGFTDSWKYFNAKGSFNFADAASYKVVGVSGRELTLKTLDGGDAGTCLLFAWRERDSTGLKWVNGFLRTGCVQPGDVGQFSGNSVISYTCWPVVTRIVSCSGDTLVVETDKVMTAALTKYEIWDDDAGEYVPDNSDVTIKIWQHAGNPATWREIIKPDYFPAKRMSRVIAASEITGTGIVTLAETAVMHPGGFDPLSPTWTFEGRRIDDESWETVPQADKRLFVEVFEAAYVAFGTDKPTGANPAITLSDDLTTIYSAFRLTYYVWSAEGNCQIVGYGRCRWSLPDPTNSGYSGAGNGNGYRCLKRAYDVHSEPYDSNDDGFDDKVDHSLAQASGIDRYPDNGLCLQHGFCDMWEPAENAESLRPFRMDLDAGHILRELWGSCNQAKVRLWPRDPSPGARQLWRVGHASLMWHAGYIGLQGPNIINFGELFFEEWRGQGLWAPPYKDSSGNIGYQDGDDRRLLTVQGGIDGFFTDEPTSDFAGLFASDTPQRDPLDPENASFTQRELPRVAPCVERGTGELQGYRGISQAPVVVKSQDIVLPAFSLDTEDMQHCAVGSFKKKTGKTSVLSLISLRQESKSGVSLGTRTAREFTAQAGGMVRIELENDEHIFSKISLPTNPGSADNFDQMHRYSAGGSWPCLPETRRRVDSHYEPHKYAGSRAAGAWPGDAIKVGGRFFVIVDVQPHGGSEAPNWGDTSYIRHAYASGGAWHANESNCTIDDVVRDITIVSVSDGPNNWTAMDDLDRPGTIPSGKFWQRGNTVFFSAADDTDSVEITYSVDDGDDEALDPVFSEWFEIKATWTLTTSMSSDDWDDADSRTVTADGEALTVISSGTPASGEILVDASGDYLVLTGHVDEAERGIMITLTFDIPADPAGDHYSISGDYTSYGKKRDVVIVYDDADGYLAGLSAGETVEFWHGEGVMLPGATLEWTPYQVDDWQAVTCDVRHGSGEFLIPEAFIETGMSAHPTVCFRLRDVRWVDHRGVMPAEVWNRTQEAVDALEWVTTGMVSGPSRQWSYSVQAWRDEGFTYVDPDNVAPCETPLVPVTGDTYVFTDVWPGNYLTTSDIGDGDASSGSIAPTFSMGIETNGIGFPRVLSFLPDGTEILDVALEISSSGLTAVKQVYNWSFSCPEGFYGEGEPDETVSDLDYVILGFTSRDEFDVVGQLPGAGDGTRVVTGAAAKAMVELMMRERATGKYRFGYAAAFFPAGMAALTEAGAAGMIPARPGSSTYTECNVVPPCTSERTFAFFPTETKYNLSWDGVSINRVVLRVKYSDEEKERVINWVRWPAQGTVV